MNHATVITAAQVSQSRELASLEPEQQREVASRVDFSSTTVRQLKVVVKQTRQPHQVAEVKTAPKPIVHRSEVHRAGHNKKSFEIIIARVVKSYEKWAYHPKVDFIKIIRTDTGIKVEIVERGK